MASNYKYIPHFPRPVLDDLITGKWLPVVGAGMSLNAVLPADKKMPLWPDLGKALGDELPEFTPNGTLDAISAYEHEYGRTRLIEKLSELLLIKEAQPGNAHKEFCKLPFDIVCTTNFDFLLERQYDLTPRYVYPVVDEDQLAIDATGTAGTLLLKLHGDLRHPKRLIVTEADYDGFLTELPLLATYLSNQLITKTAVFIGYSLDDPDFRQIWHIVSSRLGKSRRMAYAIAVGASEADVSRFARRGVKMINLPGGRSTYGETLATAFSELRDYMLNRVISVSKVTEEKPLEELLLPRTRTSRLCFFALPLDLLSFYREYVFPSVEDAGFVPITADDVVSPGASINAKLDSLIDRASVMVIELSTSWTRAEFRMAIARLSESHAPDALKRQLRLIVVVTNPEQVPPNFSSITVIVRPDRVTKAPTDFVAEITSRLSNIAGDLGVRRPEEAQRLFDVREYRAAVISAMSHLEQNLREQIEKAPLLAPLRPGPLFGLIRFAAEQGFLTAKWEAKIRKWMQVRNSAVHSSTEVTKAEAREIVNGVTELVNGWASDTGL